MPVITINGPIGAGNIEIGQLLSHRLNIDYVDRMVFAEAAKLTGSPVGTLMAKEQKVLRFREKLGSFLQDMLERSAVSGISGEAYFGRGMEMLPAETYEELAGDPTRPGQKLNDKAFIEATTSVVKELAGNGNVVIIGRGSNIILQDVPGVLHIGLTASSEVCAATVLARENFSEPEAMKYTKELEEARIMFYKKFFKVSPSDSTLYHLMLNMNRLTLDVASNMIIHTIDAV
jgi:cytidylate kinase